MRCSGDFGGITYSAGDFHTNGQSGFSGISYETGDFVTPGTSGFGEIGTYFEKTKSFIKDNQVPLLAGSILIIGLMALADKKRT